MSAIGPTYPAHIVVSQAEIRLVADQTANANTETIKSDQSRIEAAKVAAKRRTPELSAWTSSPDWRALRKLLPVPLLMMVE